MLDFIPTDIQNALQVAFTVFGAFVAFASVVVKVTPTQKDDAVLAKIVAVLDYFSVVTARKDV